MLSECTADIPQLRMRCGCFAHQRVVFEGSAAAPVQTHTAMLPRSKLSAVLLRLVLQGAASAVFEVWPEVLMKVYAKNSFMRKQVRQMKGQKQQGTWTKN